MENILFGNAPVSDINSKLKQVSLNDLYSIIKKDKKLKKHTEEIRNTKEHTQQKLLKSSLLPYILPFKYSSMARNQKYFESANCMIFEADDVVNLDKKIQEIENDNICRFLYTSVSGTGFKLLVKLNDNIDDKYFVRVYNVIRIILNNRYKITFDPSSKDLARVQYLSFDPNCYYNKNSIELDVIEIIKNLKIIDESSAYERGRPSDVEYDVDTIKQAIKFIRKNGYLDRKDEQLWWELSMSIASLGEEGREYFIMLSQDHPLYPEDNLKNLNKRYDKFMQAWGNYHDEERVLNMSAFFNKVQKEFKFKLPKSAKTGKKSLEFLLADKFTNKYRDLLLYDHSKSGKGRTYGWYFWTNQYFQLSKKGEISEFYLKFINDEKKLALEAAKKKQEAEKSLGMSDGTNDVPINVETEGAFSLVQISKAESRRFRDLTLTWAGERDGLGILPDELDQNNDLFCCLNGVINLRTQELLEHSPKFRQTKISQTIYQPKAKYPNWDNFINKISFNNPEIYNYIQEAVGYTLTGYTSEQCLFFLYGIGANGKSTFLEGLKLIFGDYQIHSNYETFTSLARDGSSHSEDVVRLKGSRLVISTEINAHKSLNESVIKQVTGGDIITARDLHSSSIEFRPTFKLWIAGNHKPKINNFDYGIRRRIFIIPFEYTFSEKEIRPQYEVIEEFKKERSGILNWALEGAARWFKQKKLNVPQIVSDTTQKYFLENNVIEQFLQEHCVLYNKDNEATYGINEESKKLYQEYIEYVNGLNEERLGRNSFYNRLEELGYKREVSPSKQIVFKGLKLKENSNSNNSQERESIKNKKRGAMPE